MFGYNYLLASSRMNRLIKNLNLLRFEVQPDVVFFNDTFWVGTMIYIPFYIFILGRFASVHNVDFQATHLLF